LQPLGEILLRAERQVLIRLRLALKVPWQEVQQELVLVLVSSESSL